MQISHVLKYSENKLLEFAVFSKSEPTKPRQTVINSIINYGKAVRV